MSKWTKSSYSVTGDSVEVQFVKSTYSSTNGSCVEVAASPEQILVRDSKDQDGPVLTFTPAEWDAFVKGAKAGEFG